MITQSYKLNRNKRLVKSTFENYLHPTIPCSFPCCESPHNHHKDYFVIPTKEVLSNYLPLFESKHVDAIILQSTLKNIKDYKRVRDCIKNQFVFCNNVFEKTFVEEIKVYKKAKIDNSTNLLENNKTNETFNAKKQIVYNDLSVYNIEDFADINEYNQILKVFNYYLEHIDKKFAILTMSNIDDYANTKEMQDLLYKSEKEKTDYIEYFNNELLEIKVKEGSVFKGTLYVNNFNCFSGIVHSKYKGKNIRIRIVGRMDMNRAINMDNVYVEIKNENEEIIDLIENDIRFIKKNDKVKIKNKNIIDLYEKIENDNDNLENKKIEMENDKVKNEKKEIKNSKKKPIDDEIFGKIIGISNRIYKPIIGTIDKNSISSQKSQNVLVIPLDRKLPKIRIRTSQAEELEGKRILVKMNEWEKDSFYPFGSYIKRIGKVGDEKSEIESILIMNGIDYKNYEDDFGIESVICDLEEQINNENEKKEKGISNTEKDFDNSKNYEIEKKYDNKEKYNDKKEVNITNINNDLEEDFFFKKRRIDGKIKDLNETYKKAVLSELNIRKDLRNENVVSIDPPGCTDVDDALHCKIINDKIEVGVHIADVSFFIKIDSLLDKEASKRGTTVYLTDRRMDMIPTFLASNLCSLIENEDRLVFSVIFTFDKDFNIIDKKFEKCVINSKKSFTYEQAQNLIDGNDNCKIKESITMLNELAKKLKKERHEKGALELSSNEFKIQTKKKIDFKKLEKNDIFIENNEKEFKTSQEHTNTENLKNLITNENIKNSNENNTDTKYYEKNSFTDNENSDKELDVLPEIEAIEQKTHFETNSLIEEFMLLANVAVAEKLFENLKDCSLLRRHPKFADDSFDELKEYLQKKTLI